MNKGILTAGAGAVLAAGLAWYHFAARRPGGPGPASAVPAMPAAPPPEPQPGPPPARVLTDGPALFKKAFWRDPGPGDNILNAERREWSDGQGVTRWEWFLEVDASPDLVQYLREDNAFGLHRVPAGELPERPPAWFRFTPEEADIFQSRTGKLQIAFHKDSRRLHASSAGAGFSRGAAAPAETSAPAGNFRPAPVPGRLPATPPPHPNP